MNGPGRGVAAGHRILLRSADLRARVDPARPDRPGRGALHSPNFAFSIGENFLASFLPSLARPQEMARVSGFSWACAYGAALPAPSS